MDALESARKAAGECAAAEGGRWAEGGRPVLAGRDGEEYGGDWSSQEKRTNTANRLGGAGEQIARTRVRESKMIDEILQIMQEGKTIAEIAAEKVSRSADK